MVSICRLRCLRPVQVQLQRAGAARQVLLRHLCGSQRHRYSQLNVTVVMTTTTNYKFKVTRYEAIIMVIIFWGRNTLFCFCNCHFSKGALIHPTSRLAGVERGGGGELPNPNSRCLSLPFALRKPMTPLPLKDPVTLPTNTPARKISDFIPVQPNR